MTAPQPLPEEKVQRRQVLAWELAGSLLIVLAGAALHFLFVWTGYWRPAAIIAVIAGQMVSYKLLTAEGIGRLWLKGLAVALIAVMFVVYSLLSYFPPCNFLFAHPDTGEYGILESYEGHEHEQDHVDWSRFRCLPDRLLAGAMAVTDTIHKDTAKQLGNDFGSPIP